MTTNKEILHKLIEGCDMAKSFGVPTVVWELLVTLCSEIYGETGSSVLEAYHSSYNAAPYGTSSAVHHTLGDLKVCPARIIAMLKDLRGTP